MSHWQPSREAIQFKQREEELGRRIAHVEGMLGEPIDYCTPDLMALTEDGEFVDGSLFLQEYPQIKVRSPIGRRPDGSCDEIGEPYAVKLQRVHLVDYCARDDTLPASTDEEAFVVAGVSWAALHIEGRQRNPDTAGAWFHVVTNIPRAFRGKMQAVPDAQATGAAPYRFTEVKYQYEASERAYRRLEQAAYSERAVTRQRMFGQWLVEMERAQKWQEQQARHSGGGRHHRRTDS